VLSGVNRGHNVAEDTVYSGTVGGAMEASLHGLRAIALSQYFGAAGGDAFNAARQRPAAAIRRRSGHGASVVRRLLDAAAWDEPPFRVFYNVNFPAVPAEEVRGLRATFQGARAGASFGVEPQVAPNGRTYLWLTHGRGNADTAPGSDSRECHDGYVTVTPLRADLTAHDHVAPLARALAGEAPPAAGHG
jgi:5'-nucleotidase